MRPTSPLLVVALLVSACPSRETPRAATRERADESTAAVAEATRACRERLATLEQRRDALGADIASRRERRRTAQARLEAARATPQPDPAAIATWEYALAEDTQAQAAIDAELGALGPRIGAERARCAAIRAPE